MPIIPPTQPPFKNIPGALPPVLWHLLTGRPASLANVADRLFADATHPTRFLDADLIPREETFITIFNHYESPSAASWWGPLLMSRAIAAERTAEPRQVRWVMAREWWYPGGFGRAVKQPLTRFAFARFSLAYGFVLVPPVLGGGEFRGEGVAGVRHALALTRGSHPLLVGMSPEGFGGPGGTLREPPSGAGLFLLLLAHDSIPCLPIGWYEDQDKVITIQFGIPFPLTMPKQRDRHARDRAAAGLAMSKIAGLLPERLRGPYKTT